VGKKGAIAAKEADKIIDRLILGCESTTEIGVMTKSGEYRIKKCTKYDLGSGYRLVTILNADRLFVTYIGTHDACNVWLEKNRFLQPRADKSRGKILMVEKRVGDKPTAERQVSEIADEPSLEPIEERYLRRIFQGLLSRGVEG
jgi:hypothetical protein